MEAEVTFFEEDRVLWYDLKGFFSAERTRTEVDYFRESLKSFPAGQTRLVINSSEMKTLRPEILPMLVECFEMYKEFQTCIIVNPVSQIAKIQWHRIAEDAGFTGFFVDSKAEARDILNSYD